MSGGPACLPPKKIDGALLSGDTPQVMLGNRIKTHMQMGAKSRLKPNVLVAVSQCPRQVQIVRDLNTCEQVTVSQCATS